MFCYQCQETAKGTGCTVMGVCGKKGETSDLQDLLLFADKGVCAYSQLLRGKPEFEKYAKVVNRYLVNSLFITITNANFDNNAILDEINAGIALRDELKDLATSLGLKIDEKYMPLLSLVAGTDAELVEFSTNKFVGVMRTEDENIRSLRELMLYGLKGMAAYTEHALNLGMENEELYKFIEKAMLASIDDSYTLDDMIALVLETGTHGVMAMALLDKANTTAYGNPTISNVKIDTGKRPGILISGHDLHDIKELLEQSKDAGIDIYTHCEMLPANYYPELKKYEHLYGNYGGSWWHQKEEFSKFNGPILFTTNCIVPPAPNANYKDKMFTTNAAGFPGWKRILPDENGKKDFSEIIELAKTCEPPIALEQGEIVGGFAHNQVLALAPTVIENIKNGSIKRFIVMAGCDGRMKDRDYYTKFAEALPKDTIILTAGCAKFRYNKLNLGDINGIPRVLDAGQCNDSYSLVQIALALKDAFGLESVNDLPLTYNIAWYEQKAVIVLLALLSLNVKNIHLGPTLPAFLSPAVATVLVEKFGIAGIGTVEDDMTLFGL